MSDLIERATRDATQPLIAQVMSTGDQGQIHHGSQQVFLDLADRSFYFYLEVWTLGEPSVAVTQLEVGTSYIVRVTVSLNPFCPKPGVTAIDLQQTAIKMDRALMLSLVVEPAEQVELSIHTHRLQVRERHSWFCDFPLKIQETCQSGKLELCLYQQEADSPTPRSFASVIRLSVRGRYGSVLEPIHTVLALGGKPSTETAFLYIRGIDETHLELIAWSPGQPEAPVYLQQVEWNGIIFNTQPNEDKYLQTVINLTHNLSRRDETLAVSAWAEQLLNTFPDCCFTIIDHSDTGIPWEMLRLPNERYLCTEALVVRLVEAHYRSGKLKLCLQTNDLGGRLVACAPYSYVTHPWLEGLASDLVDDPENLQDYLFDNPAGQPVGLVYITLNDPLSYGDEQGPLASIFQHYERIHTMSFNEIGGTLTHRPFFLVSTPFSARMPRHQGRTCGLAHGVLTEVATSYIGALGPVRSEYASWLAQTICELAHRPEGVQPAVLLRQLRAELLARYHESGLPPQERERIRKKLHYLGTYVYYGNPQTRLHLDRERNGQ